MAPRFIPKLEELSPRIVPAHHALPAPATSPALVTEPGAGHTAQQTALAGHGHGSYSADPIISGAGPQYQLQGQALLKGLGDMAVTGSLHGVGFIENGHAGGTLTFTNDSGSITIQLTGPTQLAFSPLPKKYSYTVTGGTGAYQNFQGQGSLDLGLKANSKEPAYHGMFHFRFLSQPVNLDKRP